VFKQQILSSILLSFFALTSIAQQSVLETTPATMVSAPLEYQLDGVIEATKQATLSAEVSGRIEEINFDVDDRVKKGDVIVRIRDNEYRARLQNAKAALAEAQAGFDDAQSEFNRIRGLYKKKVVSKAEFDKASANLESSKARVTASQANVSEAQEQLNNTVIRAPYSGIVVERHVELGESTGIGQPIMSGYAIGELRVNVNVPQTIINAVRKFRQTRVNFLDNSVSIESKKLTIFPFADPKNHSFKVRIDLPESLANIFPGMLVKVSFVIDQSERLTIPAQALVHRSEVIGVYVVNSNAQVSFRQVRTGQASGTTVEITAGLEAGEMVAINPVAAGILLKAHWNAAQ